ncbi:MAG: Flp family type IVb pilin [Isosphaeraceae bacterium]
MRPRASRFRHFIGSEDGPTAVEYAVMLAMVGVAILTIISSIATSISGTLSTVNSSLS